MIFLHGHGRTVIPDDAIRSYPLGQAMPLSAACGFSAGEYYPNDPPLAPFHYFFRNAPDLSQVPGRTAALDRLADAMAEPAPEPDIASDIPPVMTYLGQFIDHDVTANTDREAGLSRIDVAEVEPAPRDEVERGLGNLRTGALDLDSVYGDAVLQGGFAEKLRAALRFPRDRAKLWLGTLVDTGDGTVPGPADPARDLLRLGRLMQGNGSPVTEADIRALPDELRALYVHPDGTLRLQRAIIGDPRNDENLAVAQLHVAFLRLHNTIVDALRDAGVTGDADDLFAHARRELTAIYQWLVLNAYLPAICDEETLAAVVAEGAPLYARFAAASGPRPRPDLLPMPLEFSVAAFRFGHSMVRAGYDWSGRFGDAGAGAAPILPQAPFGLLFAFTGGARVPMPLADGSGSAPRLPAHWPVEWDRFAGPVDPSRPRRSARPIDTRLAPPLFDMQNDVPGANMPEVMRHLARRNLRRGHRLNIPSAQSCLDGIEHATGERLPRLGEVDLVSGPAGQALAAGGLAAETPLWFYVLKEAEVLGRDGRLGPLGSRLVAETLVGLLALDPRSVWHRHGSGPGGMWHPRDGARPRGQVVDSMPAFFRGAGFQL